LDNQGSIPGRGWDFSLHHHIQTGSRAHPASYPMGTRVSFPGGKVARACAKVTNVGSYTSTPPIYLNGMVLN